MVLVSDHDDLWISPAGGGPAFYADGDREVSSELTGGTKYSDTRAPGVPQNELERLW